jgi:Protein of unknown function (DUF3627)
LANWISADYALVVTDFVFHFISNAYRGTYENEKELRLKAENDVINEKNGRLRAEKLADLIDQQNTIYNLELGKVEEELNQLKLKLTEVEGELNQMKTKMTDEIKSKEMELIGKEVEIARKDAEIAITGVTLMDTEEELKKVKCVNKKNQELWASTHACTIMKINDGESKCAYYVINRVRRDMDRAVQRFMKKYPKATIFYQQMHIPSTVEIFNRLKLNKAVTTVRNFFNITCCEHDLIHKIDLLNANMIRKPIVNYS